MLIDSTYFTGSLTIPQLGQPAVVDALNIFIQQQEPLFLQAALGYELWEDFVVGLNAPSVDQKWINLRDGVTFDATGMWPPFIWKNGRMNYNRDWFIPQNPSRRKRWVGFCGGQPVTGNNSNGSTLVLVAGQPGNPIPGTNVYTTPILANSTYWIERRGFGAMTKEGDTDAQGNPVLNPDVRINNNGQTITLLHAGDKFNNGEVFILHFINLLTTGTPAIVYQSPLACQIYYEWFRDQAANLSAFGVVAGESENSIPAMGMLKMSDAFNRASKYILDLWGYLDLINRTDVTIYSSYDRLKIDYNYFKPINKVGF